MSDPRTALISATVSAIVSLTVSYLLRRSQQRAAIDAKLMKSIELAMSYPHVEDSEYCDKWPDGNSDTEKRIQYDLYCCYVFNLIEDIWRHCWNVSQVERILYVREFIQTHRCWWEKQDMNLTGYEKSFRAYVQSVIDDIKRKEKNL